MMRKRWLVGGGLATLALASTLTAGTVFADSTGTPTATNAQTTAQTFIDRLAQNLGLSSDQVKQGMQKTEDSLVTDAVNSGKITADQGNALKQKIDSGNVAPFMFGGGFGRGHHRGFGAEDNAIAQALGMTESQLQQKLSSGSTLKQVITDQGKTVDDVVNAVVAQEKSKLDQVVTNGKMTQDQETQRLNSLKQQLTDAINNNTLGRGPFGGHGPHGGQPQQTPAPTS